MNKISSIGLIAPARSKSTSYYCFNTEMRDWFETNLNVPRSHHPNLAILTIAGLTPKDIKITIIDERVDDITGDEDFDIVGISMMTAQAPRGYEIAKLYKKKGKYIVFGGMHVTVCPEEASKYCDTIIVGEAELTWPQFLDDYSNGTQKKKYSDQTIDISKSPVPRYDLLDLNGFNLVPMQTTRGCPIACKFCSVTTVFGPKFRVKGLNQLELELDEIRKFAPTKQIVFNDDNMFVWRKKSYEILEMLKGHNIRYFAESDISIAEDDKLLKLMRDSGCVMVFLGLESLVPENLARMNTNKWKLKKLKNYRESCDKIQSYGINIIGSFIVGLENDTRESLDELKNFVINSKILAQFSYLMPFPGTVWRDDLIKKGKISKKDLTNWDVYTSYDAVIEPSNMSKKELVSIVTNMWKEIYTDEQKGSRIRHMVDKMKARREEDKIKEIYKDLDTGGNVFIGDPSKNSNFLNDNQFVIDDI